MNPADDSCAASGKQRTGVCEYVKVLETRIGERMAANADMAKLRHEALDTRLDTMTEKLVHLNGLREQAISDKMKFLSRSDYEIRHEEVVKRIEAVGKTVDVYLAQTKAILAAVAFGLGLLELVLRFVVK